MVETDVRLGIPRRRFLLTSASLIACGCGVSGSPEPDADDAHTKASTDPERKGSLPETIDVESIRKANLAKLDERGFSVAGTLPVWKDRITLRPVKEIAERLMAIDAVFTWVSATEEIVDGESVKEYAKRNALREAMTPDEREQFDLPRERAHENADTAGWWLENMWALAWVLGFDPKPDVTGGMIEQEVSEAIQGTFLPRLNETTDDFLVEVEPRSNRQVVEAHDLFYCAHNAVRSAQLGRDTVPEGFHPVVDGGTVHERRHSLTWCLSPGVAWDDTDLST